MNRSTAQICAVAMLAVSTRTPAADQVSDNAGTMPALQLAVGSCLVAQPPQSATKSDKEKALFEAIATSAITEGVNYLGRALTAAGTSKTWTITGARNLELKRAFLPDDCVQVVRGNFVTAGSSIGQWSSPEGWPANLPKALSERGIWLDGAPDFLFEGRFVTSADQSTTTIRPIVAFYSKPIGTRMFRWGSDRNVALFFSITPPGTKPSIDTNPAATVVLGKMTPSTKYRYEDSPKYASPYESPWFSISKADLAKPLTITAMLSETQDDDAFLTFLGTIFSDEKVKTAEETALTQTFVPSAKKQAAQSATNSAVTAANDADTKYAEAVTKLKACMNATDGPSTVTAGSDARAALRSFAIADGLSSEPMGSVTLDTANEINLSKSSGEIKSACSKVLSAIASS